MHISVIGRKFLFNASQIHRKQRIHHCLHTFLPQCTFPFTLSPCTPHNRNISQSNPHIPKQIFSVSSPLCGTNTRHENGIDSHYILPTHPLACPPMCIYLVFWNLVRSVELSLCKLYIPHLILPSSVVHNFNQISLWHQPAFASAILRKWMSWISILALGINFFRLNCFSTAKMTACHWISLLPVTVQKPSIVSKIFDSFSRSPTSQLKTSTIWHMSFEFSLGMFETN